MKALARVVLILAAIGVGAVLFRAAPREVTLVYGLPAGEAPASRAGDIRRGGDLLRHAEIRLKEPHGRSRARVSVKPRAPGPGPDEPWPEEP